MSGSSLSFAFSMKAREVMTCFKPANWQQAISKDLEVPSNHWPPEAVKWKKFATLADPTAAALAVWSSGYLLEASFDEVDRTVRFYAPAAR